MIKKFLSIAAIIALIILFTATYFLAGATEQAFHRQVTELNQLAPGKLKATVQSYDRQFFSARARTEIRLGTHQPIQLNHQIRHFLWGVEIRSTLAHSGALADVAVSPQLEELPIISHIAPDGSISSRFDADSVSVKTDQETLKLSALQLTINQNQELSEADIIYNIQGLDLEEADQKIFSSTDIDGNFRLENLRGTPTGLIRTRIREFRLNIPQSLPVRVNELHFSSEASKDGQSFNIASQTSFGKLSVAEDIFTAGGIEVQISGLNQDLIEQYKELLDGWLESKNATNGEANALRFKLFSLAMDMLSSDLRFDLKSITVASNEGRFTGHGHWILNTAGTDKLPAFSLFGNSEAQLVLELDKDLFRAGYILLHRLQNHASISREEMTARTRLMERQLIRQGILESDEDRYLLNFSWADGRGELNGRPLSWN